MRLRTSCIAIIVAVCTCLYGLLAQEQNLYVDGLVGIGTTSPLHRVDVVGDNANNNDAAISVTAGSAGEEARVVLKNIDGEQWQIAHYNGSSTLNFGRFLGGGAWQRNHLSIASSGNVGIGTTSPSYKPHVNGDAAGTSWTNFSARDYKDAIEPVRADEEQTMLTRLIALELSRYTYKGTLGAEGRRRLGFLAEDMPHDVLSADGTGVDIYELLTYTIGALKALKSQKDAEIAGLKAKLTRLTHERSQWHAVLAAYTARLQAQDARLQQIETRLASAQRISE